jgi:hypothetical protein
MKKMQMPAELSRKEQEKLDMRLAQYAQAESNYDRHETRKLWRKAQTTYDDLMLCVAQIVGAHEEQALSHEPSRTLSTADILRAGAYLRQQLKMVPPPVDPFYWSAGAIHQPASPVQTAMADQEEPGPASEWEGARGVVTEEPSSPPIPPKLDLTGMTESEAFSAVLDHYGLSYEAPAPPPVGDRPVDIADICSGMAGRMYYRGLPLNRFPNYGPWEGTWPQVGIVNQHNWTQTSRAALDFLRDEALLSNDLMTLLNQENP